MKPSLAASGLVVGPRRLGALQSDVMDILWADGGWLTPDVVSGRLKRPRKYTTVMTVLSRLHAQGILERDRVRRAFSYRAVSPRDEFYADRLSSILHSASDPASALAGFVSSLDDQQRTELREVLRRSDPPR